MSLPNGIEIQGTARFGDPGNGLPKFVRQIAENRGYGDAKHAWTMYVHENDIDLAFTEKAHGDGNACVMAQAGRRLGAQMIYFYRTTAWVDFGSGPLVRYQIPDTTYRNVIDPFDKGVKGDVMPGMYPLLAPRPSRTLARREQQNKRRKPTTQNRNINPKKQRQHSERVILASKA